MKKKFLSLFLILVFLYCLSVTAFAAGNFTVKFKNDGTLDSGDIRTGQIEQIVGNMQPGDTESITVKLENAHSGATRWYMWNRVFYIQHSATITLRKIINRLQLSKLQ